MTKKPEASLEDRVVDATMALAAEWPWDEVRLSDIAARAGVTPAELRRAFDSRTDILAAFSRRIDAAVLEGHDAEMAEEPARERLFDVLMRRLEALAPYRPALVNLMRAAERDPLLVAEWNPIGRRSMRWMMEAAGLDGRGRAAELRAQGLAVLFARTLRVFIEDDDPGLARTMADLDRRLRDGEQMLRRAEDAMRLAGLVGAMLRPRRRRRDARPRDWPDDNGPATDPAASVH